MTSVDSDWLVYSGYLVEKGMDISLMNSVKCDICCIYPYINSLECYGVSWLGYCWKVDEYLKV